MTLTAAPPAAGQLLAAAEAMVPALRERGPEAEELRQQPPATIADFEAAGFFTAMLPAARDGSAIGLATFAKIIRTVARGDASAGWIAAFLMSHNYLLSRFGEQAQEEFFATAPYPLAVAAANPPGKAEKVDGGWRVSGRWGFGSGVMHANWALLTAIPTDYPSPPLAVTVPLRQLTVVDTWHVPGMKATGSNDIVADGVFVPDYRALPFPVYAFDQPPGAALAPDYALLRYPLTRVLSLIHAAVALGTADAALELFAASVGKRSRAQTRGKVIDEPLVRSKYAKAWDLVNVAGLELDNAIAVTDAAYGAGPAAEVSLTDRARINLGVTGAGAKAFRAVDLLVQAAGASIHRTGNALDRICRDTQVMRNHAAVDFETMSGVAGGALLGAGLGDYAEDLF